MAVEASLSTPYGGASASTSESSSSNQAAKQALGSADKQIKV